MVTPIDFFNSRCNDNIVNNDVQAGETMNENLMRTNVVLTIPLRKALQKEANRKYGGKISMLLRQMIGERYKLPYLLPHEIEEAK